MAAEPPAAVAAAVDGNAAVSASEVMATRLRELGVATAGAPAAGDVGALQESAQKLALASIVDIGVFFFVLLVGFAYVWKRGDLDWVRAVTQKREQPAYRGPPVRAVERSQSILSA
jgi:NADH-quinone oxidoreductase subunit A